jgi:glycosyltransferase involved in cell wall biosynthesis
MPNPQPLVSIVIPAHNAARYLGETLASASAQRYKELEIIVVDDGSTDDTAEVTLRHARRDPRVRLIRQANTGVGAARNTGIAVARGKYIAPLDADDLWDPEKIPAQVAEMEWQGERAGFVYCWSRTIDEAGRFTGLKPPCSAAGRVFNVLLFRNFLHNASVPLFRASVLQRVGGYATREEQGGAQGCEDWELLLRIAEHHDVCVVPRVLVSYRVFISGLSFNVGTMERSYLWLIAQVRRRSPATPEWVFRWSRGHYYLYIAIKARQSGQYETCRRCLGVAVQADRAVLFAPVAYYNWFMSWYRRWFPLPAKTASPPGATAATRPGPPSPLPPATKHRPGFLSANRWRVRGLLNARIFWALYHEIERRRLALILKSPSP